MISIEVMLVVAFTLIGGTMYVMWRHLDEKICGFSLEMKHQLMDYIFTITSTDRKQIELLEQKLKDGLQSSSICCRSGLDRINSRISLLPLEKTIDHFPRGRIMRFFRYNPPLFVEREEV